MILKQRMDHLILQNSPPHRLDATGWKRSFSETKNCHRGGEGRPETSTETIQRVKQLFRMNQLSVFCDVSIKLQFPAVRVHRILGECILLSPNKLETLQTSSERDKQKGLEFAEQCSTQPNGY